MSFFFRPAFFPDRSTHSTTRPSISDDEAYYRRVAEEHQRRAQAALALAQEEERRRRQAAAQRQYHEDPYSRPEYRPEYVHTRPHYPHGLFDFPFDLYDSPHPPRYEHLPDVPQRPPSPIPRSRDQAARDDHERQIEAWLQRRRQRELEEAEFRRLKELERRRDDEMMREMLAAFGVDSLQRTRASPNITSSPRLTRRPLEEELDSTSAPRQTPAHSQTCACGRHIPSPRPVQTSEPESASSQSTSPDFATQLWNALSGGRSEAERASILRDLGIGLPFGVQIAPTVHHPAPEQRPAPAQQNPTAPKPTTPKPQTETRRPAPIPVPVIVRSAPSPTPQPKATPSPSSSPAPVKITPFAHIESIQNKFDALRASAPDFSNHQKKREYLAELNKLLTSLDAVESSGSESVRGARKALVRAVEDELEKVEGSQEDKHEEKHEDKHEEKHEDKHEEPVEEKQMEDVGVDTEEEQKPVVVEAAPEHPTSAEHVPEEVEFQTVSGSDSTQVHPAAPAVEEPISPTTTTQTQPTEPEPSTERIEVKSVARDEAPATVPDTTVPTSDDSAKPEVNEEANEPSQDTEEEQQPERGRQPAVTSQAPKSPKARRPPSVEIEEVPDEESLSGSPQVGYKDL